MSIFIDDKGLSIPITWCRNDLSHPRAFDSGECPKCRALFCEHCFKTHIETCKGRAHVDPAGELT